MTSPPEPLAARVDRLVERVATVDWRALDDATREATLRALLDALGIAAGGPAAPGIAATLGALGEVGGSGDVPVPWWSSPLPPGDAAFALSLLIHGWDFDDTHDEAVVHACTVAVPAAYSTAWAIGASGRRMLEGVVAGIEVVLRLSLVLGPQVGMIRTAGLGPLGAAAAAARVLDLGPEGMARALALATPMSASPLTRQVIEDGAITKRHQPGFGVRHGLLAAHLARAGVEGAPGWFTGTFGLQALVADADAARRALDRGGWEVDRLSLKPYPACRYVHAAVAGALELRPDLPSGAAAAGGPADAIARVRVHVPAGMAHELVARPWARRGRPVVDAQFSIPWTVAAALVRGDLGLGALTDAALHDAATEALARRVEVVQDRAPDATGMAPVTVAVLDGAGREHRAEVTAVPGSPAAPLDWEAIVAKARGCMEVAGLPGDLADRLRGEVLALPDGDVRTGLTTATSASATAHHKEQETWISA